ncbi:di-heme oxidoredictase family protein [Haliangium sp.]|uniref:di-heme oxidoredictase family protein n=2 Tax=Haliangium sp. TaxID=2663208 RepID=UPI003D0CDF22
MTCGQGTMLMGNNCVPAGMQVTCGAGTMLSSGECVPTGMPVECGEGTELSGSECVPVAEPLEFELDEEESGYAELTEVLEVMAAADADGFLDQAVINTWATMTPSMEQIEFLFDHGDELTEISFTEADGVGSLLMPDGVTELPSRFTRVPTGGRFTGPNAASCLSCHFSPIGNSGGPAVANVMQDPDPGTPGLFNVRQTISIQGGGLIQILAEDMTAELQTLKQNALDNPDTAVALKVADGQVDYGTITCDSQGDCNYESVVGISPDLIVRPMGWKGNFPTLRGFSSDAGFGEMGMQSDEVRWKQLDPGGNGKPTDDGDGDGVGRELSVGDVTALTLYLSLQEMPTTVIELADAGLTTLAAADRTLITEGETLFGTLGCDGCHVPEFKISTTIFQEPTARANNAFEDVDLVARDAGYTSNTPFEVDLSAFPADEPRVVKETDGTAIIRPYTDLKRHFMGDHLADDAKAYFPKNASQFDVTLLPEDADQASQNNVVTQIPLGEFLTPELWGVGNSGPWMHDGRATTLREAILQHGVEVPGGNPSEAQGARDAFAALGKADQDKVIAFLKNLVLVEMSAP